MIEFFEILLIAIAQGIGEFLPISSSGHNAVVNHLFERFGVPLAQDGSEFIKLNILLHVGTLVAVLIVFRQRIIDMLGKDQRLIPILIAATVPAVLVGFPIHKFAPWLEDCLPLISGCFIITGFLLLTSLRLPEGEKTTSTMSWQDAVIIGCAQAFAILPGVSRSGTTIVMGLFCKLKREEAAAFSFLLSIPVIAGSGLLEAKNLFKAAPAETGAIPNWLLFVGMAVSSVVGIIALIWLLDWLKKGKLWYFAVWVFAMSPITLVLAVLPLPERPQAKQTEEQQSQLDTVIQIDEAEREKILAEEKAKELALIEEERKIIPLVDDPDKLIPLDPQDRIWITADQKSVVLLSRVAMREGLLELLACRVRTKEHESILSVRVKPYLIHAALLAANARVGKPMQASPFVPATGDTISITLRWKAPSGTQMECQAQHWVWDAANSKESAKQSMTTHWVFSGSAEYEDGEGNRRYVANESGELFGLSNFVGSILDIPIQSSADNTQLQFACFTERIPPLDTPVTIILTPAR